MSNEFIGEGDIGDWMFAWISERACRTEVIRSYGVAIVRRLVDDFEAEFWGIVALWVWIDIIRIENAIAFVAVIAAVSKRFWIAADSVFHLYRLPSVCTGVVVESM